MHTCLFCLQTFVIGYSNEKIAIIEKREQFLKNTFESLGKTEQDFQNDDYHHTSGLFKCLRSYFQNIFLYIIYVIFQVKRVYLHSTKKLQYKIRILILKKIEKNSKNVLILLERR